MSVIYEPTSTCLSEVSTKAHFIERDCPICESKKSNLEVESSVIGDTLSFAKLKESWFGFFKDKVFFSYFRCENCNALYNKKFFNEETLKILYSSNPDNTDGLDVNMLRLTQRKYAKFLADHAALKGNYFELGPDLGVLSSEIAKMGDVEHFWFFEPNGEVHDMLRQNMKGSSVSISNEMAGFSSVPDASIDIAVLVHVLDHLIEPRKIMEQIYKKLKVGGKILIVTHDESSFLARWLRKKWPAFCLQHPHLFNIKTTKNFLEIIGLKVIKTDKAYNNFPFFYLLRHLFFALGLRIPVPKLNKPVLSLKLGNIITIAEKSR